MNFKRVLLFSLATFLLIGCGGNTYVNDEFGFELEFPSTWGENLVVEKIGRQGSRDLLGTVFIRPENDENKVLEINIADTDERSQVDKQDSQFIRENDRYAVYYWPFDDCGFEKGCESFDIISTFRFLESDTAK